MKLQCRLFKNETTNPPIENTDYEPFTKDTPINEVISDPAFREYGWLIFPADSGYYSRNTLEDLRLTWYNHINVQTTMGYFQ